MIISDQLAELIKNNDAFKLHTIGQAINAF